MRLLMGLLFLGLATGVSQLGQSATEDSAYLSWDSGAINAITKKYRSNGQVGGSFDFRKKDKAAAIQD